VSGDVFILEGAHRSMAVLLGRDRGLPWFADMLVHMVVQDELHSDACDAVVAVQSNENAMLHKQMTFPDYAVFLARVRDTAHDAKFADDVIDLAKAHLCQRGGMDRAPVCTKFVNPGSCVIGEEAAKHNLQYCSSSPSIYACRFYQYFSDWRGY
jgi:hypothetical protein